MDLSDATGKISAVRGIDPETFRLVAQCLSRGDIENKSFTFTITYLLTYYLLLENLTVSQVINNFSAF